jgi:predicted AlkP superfamily phosphohydrolase/phosphomutase
MRLMIIGLDCAAPELIFRRWKNELPHLRRMMESGFYGPLLSCHPPITVPAWTVMMTGKDPGELGIYGFRNRKDYSYSGYSLANSDAVTAERVWDTLSRRGKRVILLGVPQTYPVRPVNGLVVSDFLTPSKESDYTYPAALKDEIERVAGGYVFDVEGFRTSEKAALLDRIYAKTRKNFTVARHLVSAKPWDFFMMVEMGVDRIHHGFWSYMDVSHRRYQAGNEHEKAIFEYYRYLDGEIGELLRLVPKDTVILVVSDHGARKMDGGVCINEWLSREGLLNLTEYPAKPSPLGELNIDWERTVAWGEGGYYGRLFLNVKGREPKGVVEPKDYERTRALLIRKLEALPGPDGSKIGTRVFRPQALYRKVNGIPPDLIVYFGNLDWRSVGSVGWKAIYTLDNDTGPDEANHDWHGILMLNETGCRLAGLPSGLREGLSIYNVAPTVLAFFGVESEHRGAALFPPLRGGRWRRFWPLGASGRARGSR